MTVTVAESRPPKGAGEYERMDVPHEETFGILRTFDKTGNRKQALLDTLYTLQALDLAAEDDVVEHVWFQIPSKTDLSDTWVELWVAFKGARVPRSNPAKFPLKIDDVMRDGCCVDSAPKRASNKSFEWAFNVASPTGHSAARVKAAVALALGVDAHQVRVVKHGERDDPETVAVWEVEVVAPPLRNNPGGWQKGDRVALMDDVTNEDGDLIVAEAGDVGTVTKIEKESLWDGVKACGIVVKMDSPGSGLVVVPDFGLMTEVQYQAEADAQYADQLNRADARKRKNPTRKLRGKRVVFDAVIYSYCANCNGLVYKDGQGNWKHDRPTSDCARPAPDPRKNPMTTHPKRTYTCRKNHSWETTGHTKVCPTCGLPPDFAASVALRSKTARRPRKNPGACVCLDGKRCPMRKSMTYGVMPKQDDFDAHFRAHVPDGEFNIEVKGKHSPLVSSGEYSEDGLWHLVKQLVKGYEKGDEDAGDWASGILGSLGFEWI